MNISHEYKTFVDEVISLSIKTLGSELHSIYICGSIPKGTARMNYSDADFTLVIYNDSEDILRIVEENKKYLLEQYSFIPKIDMLTVSVKKVLTYPYEWGFWISIISECIYGDDLKESLPDIIPNADLIFALNEDTNETFDRLIKQYKESDFKDERVIKKITRRVLIALYTFIYPMEKVWIDEVSQLFLLLKSYFPQYRDHLEYIYNSYQNPLVESENFLQVIIQVRRIINQQLDEILNEHRDKERVE